MRRGIALVVLALVAAVVAVATSGVLSPAKAVASSHREAPLISTDPSVDNTDLYAFVSPDRTDTVTIIANYIPFEDPAGGPNYYKFDDSALYELKVDNNGDGKEDISYQFRFQTKLVNPNTFLYNTNRVTTPTDTDLSVLQTYSVTRVQGHSRTVLGTGLPVPPVNIGPRSTPDYDTGAGFLGDGTNGGVVRDLPGGIKVFAGPREDPFFVDLGSIFDLAGLRPFNLAHIFQLPTALGQDAAKNYNLHSIAIQVPIAQLTRDLNPTVGFYASASRPKVRILGGHDGKPRTEGPFIQVSRLGNPLVNEAIIPLGKKDFWNASDPSNDSQFLSNYTNPELAADINFFYAGALMPAPTTGRSDLVAVLLTGVPGLNFTGNTPADLLRLNTDIPVNPTPDRLGVLANPVPDLQGFPNGRRLTDDIVDIELRAFDCGYGPALNTALGLCDLTPNDTIGDGVDTNDIPFLSTFPYVASPNNGYDHTGHS